MINNTLFSWHLFDTHSDLSRLTMVVETMELDDLVHEINLRRRGTRCEWPAQAMLTALLASCVYQHFSIESLHRELARNPSLMHGIVWTRRKSTISSSNIATFRHARTSGVD